MEPTWFERDLPVLEAVVTALEYGVPMATEAAIAAKTGIAHADVRRALVALDPAYITRASDMAGYHATAVTAEARRAVGQWPTGESLADQLVSGLTAAAEHDPDPEQQNRLRQVAGFFRGAGRTILVELGSAIVQHHTPGAH